MLTHHARRIIFFLAISTFGFVSAAQAASPSGNWRGTWSSTTSGHQGPLKARIRPIGQDSYRAIFVGRFAKVVPFVYPARLERVAGTCNCYTSTQRLPLLGDYRMTATVGPTNFRADFRGPRDRGSFAMSRR
ncbi:MAG: hypothetical protein WD119_01330 [Pirellulaceae bacterium]